MDERSSRRKLFVPGFPVFLLASAVSAAAPGAAVLVLGRLAQGAGPALMIPQVFSTIQVSFQGADRGKALGAYAMVGGLASSLAQVLGGALVDSDLFGLGWRLIFVINIPLALAGVVLALRTVPESHGPDRTRLDGRGLALVTAAVLAMVVPLTLAPDYGAVWWLGLLAAPPLALGFVRTERSVTAAGRTPLIALELFRLPSLTRGLVACLLFYASNAVLFFLLPVYLQTGRGLGALQTGVLFLSVATTFALVSLLSGRFVAAHGHRLLGWGTWGLLAAYGLVAVVLLVTAELWPLLPALVLVGGTMGMAAPALQTAALDVPVEHAGTASGVVTTALELGYAGGIVAGGLVYAEAQPALPATAAFAAALVLPTGFSLAINRLMRR